MRYVRFDGVFFVSKKNITSFFFCATQISALTCSQMKLTCGALKVFKLFFAIDSCWVENACQVLLLIFKMKMKMALHINCPHSTNVKPHRTRYVLCIQRLKTYQHQYHVMGEKSALNCSNDAMIWENFAIVHYLCFNFDLANILPPFFRIHWNFGRTFLGCLHSFYGFIVINT